MQSSELFFLRRIFVDGFFHHVVDLTLDLGGVVLFLGGDGAPDKRAGGRIAQIDDQRALRIRDAHVAGAESVPTGGVGFHLGLARGAECIAHVEVSRTIGRLRQALRSQIIYDIRLDLLFYQRAVQRGIAAVQLALADGEGFVTAEVDGLIELHGDLLRPRVLRGEKREDQQRDALRHNRRRAPGGFLHAIAFDSLRHGHPPREVWRSVSGTREFSVVRAPGCVDLAMLASRTGFSLSGLDLRRTLDKTRQAEACPTEWWCGLAEVYNRACVIPASSSIHWAPIAA